MDVYLFAGSPMSHNIVFEKNSAGVYLDLRQYWGNIMFFRKIASDYEFAAWLSPDGSKVNWLPKATFDYLKAITQNSKTQWNQYYVPTPPRICPSCQTQESVRREQDAVASSLRKALDVMNEGDFSNFNRVKGTIKMAADRLAGGWT